HTQWSSSRWAVAGAVAWGATTCRTSVGAGIVLASNAGERGLTACSGLHPSASVNNMVLPVRFPLIRLIAPLLHCDCYAPDAGLACACGASLGDPRHALVMRPSRRP